MLSFFLIRTCHHQPTSHTSQLNPELGMFQRQFTSELKRCDEMERKVNYIKREIIKDGGEVNEIWNSLPRAPNPREFIDLEAMFEKTENEMLELSENFTQLLQNLQELTELQYVLERTQVSVLQTTTDEFKVDSLILLLTGVLQRSTNELRAN